MVEGGGGGRGEVQERLGMKGSFLPEKQEIGLATTEQHKQRFPSSRVGFPAGGGSVPRFLRKSFPFFVRGEAFFRRSPPPLAGFPSVRSALPRSFLDAPFHLLVLPVPAKRLPAQEPLAPKTCQWSNTVVLLK